MRRITLPFIVSLVTLVDPPSLCISAPLTLPTNDIAVLSYTGYETRLPAPGNNNTIGIGDVFEGLIQFQTVRNAEGTVDLSAQFSATELTAQYRFQVIGGGPNNHLEFGAGEFRLYVGTGAAKNFDASAADAVSRATDGQLWLRVANGGFFESVNDPFNGAPRNRAWLDITDNLTGYDLARVPFSTLLGKDPTHLWQGMIHGDHAVQAYFEDFPGPSDLPRYSFKIHGEVLLLAAPEPGTAALITAGLVVLGLLAKRNRGAIRRRRVSRATRR